MKRSFRGANSAQTLCIIRSKRTQNMHTSFAVDPQQKMSNLFVTGRSANIMRDLFMSEHLRVNLSSRNMLYQLSYLMLIERSIDTNLIVYVDVIVNQAEYKYEVWKGQGERAERSESLSMHAFSHVSPCHLHCTFMLVLKSYYIKGSFSLTVVKEFVKV